MFFHPWHIQHLQIWYWIIHNRKHHDKLSIFTRPNWQILLGRGGLLLKMSLTVQRQWKHPVIYYRKVAKVDICFRADSDQKRGNHLHQHAVNDRRGRDGWGEWLLARNNVKVSLAFTVALWNTINHINLGFTNSEFLNFRISRLIPGIKRKNSKTCLTYFKKQIIFNHASHTKHSTNPVRARWYAPWGVHTRTTTTLVIVETLQDRAAQWNFLRGWEGSII